jgi:hypothetical protein
MRIKILTVMALTGLGLSGCSLWTKSDTADKTAQSETGLRSTPGQAYAFDGQVYDVEIYDTASRYAGYDVELNDASQYYYYGYNDTGLRPLTVVETFNPRDAAFVKLNGTSNAADWQTCESRHNGYLRLSDYDVRLDPAFEVCMRNKGYVLTTEAGYSSKPSLNAKNAGLRGSFPQSSNISTSSAYFR